MPELHVFTNDYGEGYVALDAPDASKQYKKWTGEKYSAADYGAWRQVPDEKKIEIGSEEEDKHAPATATVEIKNGFFCYTATAAEWAVANGPGLLYAPEF
jgi:hypothetical protein